MTTVSTPHSFSQSARRYRSAVKAAYSRTGGSARSADTAVKWLVAPTSMPAAFRFNWDSSAGRRSRSSTAWPFRSALFRRVVIISLQHRSVGASPEGATELNHSPERDRPDWGLANDAAVGLPDHALRRAISTNVLSVSVSVSVRTTRLIKRLHHAPASSVSLLCMARTRT